MKKSNKSNKETIEYLNSIELVGGGAMRFVECKKCKHITTQIQVANDWHPEPCSKCNKIAEFKDNFKHAVKDKKFLKWVKGVLNDN